MFSNYSLVKYLIFDKIAYQEMIKKLKNIILYMVYLWPFGFYFYEVKVLVLFKDERFSKKFFVFICNQSIYILFHFI
jgi:hypothetical protein